MSGQQHASAALYHGKDPVPIVQEAGWAPGPVWRAENLAPTGIRSRTVQPLVSRYTDWATRHARTHTHTHIYMYILPTIQIITYYFFILITYIIL